MTPAHRGSTHAATSAALTPEEGAAVRRHTRVIDVFVLLYRGDGRVLLLRRTPGLYAGGRLCPPSGHLEMGETVVQGALREAAEEVGVWISPADARFCHLINYRSPEGQERLGAAFAVERWEGEPYNREPHKHTELVWANPARPPEDCVDYTAALLAAVTDNRLFSAHGYRDMQQAASPDSQQTRGGVPDGAPPAGSSLTEAPIEGMAW